MRFPIVAWTLLLLVATNASAGPRFGAGHVTGELPEHDASDASAPPVSAASVPDAERFWPFQVAVREAWQPPGATTRLRPGFPGVLVRVEPDGTARIDFGRDGVHDVPIARTDLVERTNAVRLGTAAKQAPNFLYMVGPRLLDADGESPRTFPYLQAAEHDRFLLVFADVNEAGFGEVVSALRAIERRDDLLVIVFPQGHMPDAEVRTRLRELEFPVAFVYDHLSEGYTDALLEAGTPLPAVLLVTAEGRAVHQGRWSPRTPTAIRAALGGGTARARTAAADRSGSLP